MYHKKTILACMIVPLLLAVAGCGVVDEDFEGSARLVVTSITDEGGNSTPIFYSNTWTEDDGDPDVDGDQYEGDRIPQDGAPVFETLIESVHPDYLKFTLFNEPRLGVDPPVSLTVERIVFNYRDAYGNARTFAPENITTITETIDPNDSATLTVTAIPLDMKAAEGAVGDSVLFGYSQDGQLLYGGNDAIERAAAMQWTVYADIYSRDRKNNDVIFNRSTVTVYFVNPIEAAASGGGTEIN